MLLGDAAVLPVTALAAVLLGGRALLLAEAGVLPGRRPVVLARALLLAYVLGAAAVTLRARDPGNGRRVSLELGRTIATANNTPQRLTEFLVNVVMFVPLGLLLPLAFVAARPLWRTLAVAAGASVSVEVLQYVVAFGRHSDIDDVVVNSAGAGAGWLAFRIGSRFLPTSPAAPEPRASVGGRT